MKKGQITVVLIIAAIMLLGISLYFFAKHSTTTFIPTVVVPQDVIPVKRYVDSCIYDVAEEGIVTMGLQGGFIEIPDEIAQVRSSFIGKGTNAVEKIPHWYYKGENRRPSLGYMKEQLENHIAERMMDCEAGLSNFNQLFDIKTYDYDVEVKFGGEDTIVKVEYPMEVSDKFGEQVTRLRDFGAVVPVRMRKVYDLANRTMNMENDELFLENVTMELMTSNFDFPFSGMVPKCEPEKWYVADLQDRLQNIMYYNLPRIRVANTDYVPFREDPKTYEEISEKADDIREYLMQADYEQGDPFSDAVEAAGIDKDKIPEDMYEYTHLFFDVGADDEEMKLKFVYQPLWGMNFYPQPSEGGLMSTRMMKGHRKFLSFFCLQMYHFAYDISYPVEVRIFDPGSFPDTGGYTFRFGIPVTIKENQPYKEEAGSSLFETNQPMYQFCDERDREVDIRVTGVYDGYTNQALEDVNLTFICMNHYCEIGQTGFTEGTYKFKGMVPSYCANPTIVAEKKGYLKTEKQMTSDELEIHMDKLHTVNLSFEKHLYFASDDNLEDVGREVDTENNETVVLYMSLQNSSALEQYISYPVSDESPFDSLDFVEAGGTYDLNVILKKDDEVIGGYINDNFTVSYEDLMADSQITIPVIEYRPQPVNEEQEADMMLYIYDGNYLNLEPRFS